MSTEDEAFSLLNPPTMSAILYHAPWKREGSRWENVDFETIQRCAAAGHPNTAYFVWKGQTGGHRWVARTCVDCGERIGGAVGTRALADLGFNRENLPKANNPPTVEVCARCGGDDTVEYHHWAPRHIFDDAYEWPGDYLCRACHQEWHQAVTPNMNRRRAS